MKKKNEYQFSSKIIIDFQCKVKMHDLDVILELKAGKGV